MKALNYVFDLPSIPSAYMQSEMRKTVSSTSTSDYSKPHISCLVKALA